MALVGSLAMTMPSPELAGGAALPMQQQQQQRRRSSNVAEDEVHQRASLVLQMADSLITSNNRRRRQLEQIESGKIDKIQQVIEDIMLEKPASVMDLLKEAEPEALPSREELKERYRKTKKGKQEETKHQNDDDEEEDNKTEDEEDSDDSDDDDSVPDKDEFRMTQDLIVAESKVAPPVNSDIPAETLQAHTAPLQDQLKRSYAAIVKLRENSDLRYEALEKKYLELKRAQTHGGGSSEQTKTSADPAHTAATTPNEELTRAYQAIVRLRENSDLRYNVLESKYLDLKRSHAEADARNERLEMEIETMRVELLRVLNSDDNKGATRASFSAASTMTTDGGETKTDDMMMNNSLSQILFAPSRRVSSPAILASTAAALPPSPKRNSSKPLMTPEQQKSLLQESNAHKKEHAAYRKKVQQEKKQVRNLRLTVLKEFATLCDKVEGCSRCEDHVSQLALFSVRDQIEKLQAEKEKEKEEELLQESFREEEEDDADCEPEEDDLDEEQEDESDDESQSDEGEEEKKEDDSDLFAESAKRHDGAMALLGANWEKLAEIDETKLDKKPVGRFANLSESKTEQKLRGTVSRFVAAQSGVYCRIDHDMQQTYGDLDKFDAPQRLPPAPPPPETARIRHVPPKLSTYQPPAAQQQQQPRSARHRRPTGFIPPPPLASKSDDSFDDSTIQSSSLPSLRNSYPTVVKSNVAPVKSALKNSSSHLYPSKQVLHNTVDGFPLQSPTSIVFVQDFVVESTGPPGTGKPMSDKPVDVDDVDVDVDAVDVDVDVDVDGVDVDDMGDEDEEEDEESLGKPISKLALASVDKPPSHAADVSPKNRRNTVQLPLPAPVPINDDGSLPSVREDVATVPATPAPPPPPRTSFSALDNSRHSITSLTSLASSQHSPKPALRNRKAGNRKPMRKTVSFSNVVDHAPVHFKDPPEEEVKEEEKAEPAKPEAIAEEEPAAARQLVAPAAPGEGTTGEVASRGEAKSAAGDEDDNDTSSRDTSSRASITRAGSDRPRRIPPAKLDPAERKAKREAALKEAKLAAKNVRKQSRSNRKLKVEGEDASLASSASTLTADSAKPQQQQKKSLFKNPFKRKSKSFDTATARAAGIPTEIKGETGGKQPARRSTSLSSSSAHESSRVKQPARRATSLSSSMHEGSRPQADAERPGFRKAQSARISSKDDKKKKIPASAVEC